MPGPLLIDVFANAIRLIVSSPTSLAKADSVWIGGDVSLEFLGTKSTAKKFVAASGNLRVDKGLKLVSLMDGSFDFQQIVQLDTGAGGPIVGFGALSAYKQADGGPICWLNSVRAALVDSAGLPTSANIIRGTSKAQESTLQPNQRFFITQDGPGLVMDLGALFSTLKVDSVPEAPFTLQAAVSKVALHVATGAAAATASAAAGGHRLVIKSAIVQAAPASGLMRALKADADKWTPILLRASELHMAGGWVTATDFAPEQELLLARVIDVEDTPAAATILRARGEDMSFELNLAAALAGKPAARFHYRRPDISPRQNRNYGLRIKGFGSRSGVRPVLDANIAAIDLRDTGSGKRFEYLAGVTYLPVGDITTGSRLGPKPPADGSGIATLDIPYADLALRCEDDGSGLSPLSLDTSKAAALTIAKPFLRSRPAGFTSTKLEAWELDDKFTPARDFELNANGLLPTLKESWLDDFTTRGTPQNYHSVEHPGTTLTIDSTTLIGQKMAYARVKTAAPNKTKLTVKGIGSAKEAAAYSAFCIALGWAAVKAANAPSIGEAFSADNFTVNFPKLDDKAFQKFVKSNSLSGLRVVFVTRPTGDGSLAFKDFIDQNMPLKDGKPPELFHMPFAMGLSVILYQNGKYVYELDDLAPDKGGRPLSDDQAVAYDFDTKASLDPLDLGWTDANLWATEAKAHPAVWPRAQNGKRAQLDPSQDGWRGLFLKGMPLAFLAPKVVETDFKWLKAILDTVNRGLNLDYGWLDENGASWVGGYQAPNGKIEVTGLPFYNEWKSVLRLFVLDATVEGSAGKTVTQAIGLRFELPQITDKNDPTKSLAFEGDFSYSSGETGQTLIDIRARDADAWFSSESVPGFDKIALRQVSTDFKDVVQISVDMVATADLAAALPALSSDAANPLKARILFSLGDKPDAVISLILPAEQRSTLFGKWPFTLRSITFDVAAGMLYVNGRIETGLPGLQSIGATVVVSAKEINLRIDAIHGALNFGGLTIEASAMWADSQGKPVDGVPHNGAAKMKEREIWGSLTLKDPGLIGELDLRLRIGSQGGMSYWVGALQSDAKFSLGSVATLRKPFLLFAHNADLQLDANTSLQKLLENPTKSILKALQPKMDADKWLASWKPSKTIGTTIGGGGMLQVGSAVLSTDEGDDADEHLTSILYNDTGIFRVDGFAFLISQYPVDFGIVVDWKNQLYSIGLQLPTIDLPQGAPTYSVQAGAIFLELGLRGNPHVKLSIGWPERKGSDDFDRDWDKATKVVVNGMFPINTFQGGLLISLDKKAITMGVAVRAGWTFAPPAVGGGIAEASVDAGIMIGGVFIMSFVFDEERALPASRPLQLAWQPLTAKALAEEPPAILMQMQEALQEIDFALSSLGLPDVQIVAQLYGDLWGNASVRFMGVTLVGIHVAAYIRFEVCGSLHKGIGRIRGKAGFSVSVTILCVTYSTQAQLEVTLHDGDCPMLEGGRSRLAFADLLALPELSN